MDGLIRIVHRDGRGWTREEFEELVGYARSHDDMWPPDADLWAVTFDGELRVYLLDCCQNWHMAEDLTDDMVVMYG